MVSRFVVDILSEGYAIHEDSCCILYICRMTSALTVTHWDVIMDIARKMDSTTLIRWMAFTAPDIVLRFSVFHHLRL